MKPFGILQIIALSSVLTAAACLSYLGSKYFKYGIIKMHEEIEDLQTRVKKIEETNG